LAARTKPSPALVMDGAVPPVEGTPSLSGANVMPASVASGEVAPCPMTIWPFSRVTGPV
jgi:hypothetical protein